MKKSILIVAAVLFLSAVLYSCKGTQDCPAYSKAERPQVESRT